MRPHSITRLSLCLSIAAVSVAAGACVDIVGADFPRVVERQEKSFTVDGKADVSLSTFDGSIEIRPWDKSEVHVVIEKRGADKEAVDSIQVDTKQDANHVVVDIKAPKQDEWLHFHHRSAKVIVSMPAASDLLASSGDGSIDVDGISGKLDLRSGDGSIKGHALDGEVRAHTGDGSIRLDALKGAINVDTGDGSVHLEGAFTSLRARTGDGSVRIDAAPGSAPRGDWDISTGDGTVTLALPEDFSAEIDAHTGDGRVHVADIDLSTNATIEKRSVRGRLGAGGSTVRVRSGDGSITLKRSYGSATATLPAERP